MRDRGVKFANYQVLRDTKMPAILIEGGFVDSADADKIKTEEYKQNFVRGVSKGLYDFLGLQRSDPYAEPVVEAKPVDDTDVHPSVRVQTSKADAVVEQIIKMGYACKRLDLA